LIARATPVAIDQVLRQYVANNEKAKNTKANAKAARGAVRSLGSARDTALRWMMRNFFAQMVWRIRMQPFAGLSRKDQRTAITLVNLLSNDEGDEDEGDGDDDDEDDEDDDDDDGDDDDDDDDEVLEENHRRSLDYL
jgi:hypothetical protein